MCLLRGQRDEVESKVFRYPILGPFASASQNHKQTKNSSSRYEVNSAVGCEKGNKRETFKLIPS